MRGPWGSVGHSARSKSGAKEQWGRWGWKAWIRLCRSEGAFPMGKNLALEVEVQELVSKRGRGELRSRWE